MRSSSIAPLSTLKMDAIKDVVGHVTPKKAKATGKEQDQTSRRLSLRREVSDYHLVANLAVAQMQVQWSVICCQ